MSAVENEQTVNEPPEVPEIGSEAQTASQPDHRVSPEQRIAELNSESKQRREALAEEKELSARLQSRLDRYDTEAAKRIAGEHLHAGALEDFETLAGAVGSFRGEDGELDPEKVRAAAQHLAETRPHLGINAFKLASNFDSGASVRKGARQADTFGTALKRAVGGA